MSIETEVNNLCEQVAKWAPEQKAKMAELQERMDILECNRARPDIDGGGASLAQKIWDSAEFKAFQQVGRGRTIIRIPDVKTITSGDVGSAVSGVLVPQRVGGVVTEARRQLRIRDLLTVYPCTSNAVDFVKVTAGMTKASPVASEGDEKAINDMKFSTQNEPVQTIATWVPASKQVIEDFQQLRATIDSALSFAVQAEEERQILFGDGTPPALHGLTTQAVPFDIGLLTASDGYEYVDVVSAAVQQVVASNELQPNFVVLNPNDWWKIRRTKSTVGEYIWGAPNNGAPGMMWELTVVPTSLMSQGYFLVGNSSSQACAIYERQGVTVELSTEHSDYWVRNLVALRGESRIAVVVFRPNSLCFGSLAQSPA